MAQWIYLTYGYTDSWSFVWSFKLLSTFSPVLSLFYQTLTKIKFIWKKRSRGLYRLICGLVLVLLHFWSWLNKLSPICAFTTKLSNGSASISWSDMRQRKLLRVSFLLVKPSDSKEFMPLIKKRSVLSSLWWEPSWSSFSDTQLITPWTSKSSTT